MNSFKISDERVKALEDRGRNLRLNSVSENTRKSRAMQWNCYLRACTLFGWKPLSCSSEQACLYVTYMSERLKYSSVVAYYQAVIFYHVCAGLEPVRMSDSILRATEL